MDAVKDAGADAAIIDCTAPAMPASLLGSVWNVPIVGYISTSPDMSDKSTYNTFVRVYPPYSMVSAALRALVSHYNWTTLGLFIEATSSNTQLYVSYMTRGIVAEFSRNMTLVTYSVNTGFNDSQAVDGLKTLSQQSRS